MGCLSIYVGLSGFQDSYAADSTTQHDTIATRREIDRETEGRGPRRMEEGESRKRKRGSRGGKRRKKPQVLNSPSSSHHKTNNNEKDYKSLQLSEHSEEDKGSVVPSPVPKQKQRHRISTKPQSLRKPSNFLDKARARLSGGHFRMINEKLYTCTGNEALNYFKEDPSLFDMYHAGYQEQMSHWPELPVNIIIKWLKDRSPSLVVADFGCGDACLAKNVKNKVFSIDLVSGDPSVIACDMANTPLGSSTIDVAVFCLSLMGTDFPSYLQEAHRVLKPSGWLLIAEVKSRFDPNTGGADPNRFAKAVCKLGFTSVSKDFSNKMFILLYYKKKEQQYSDKEGNIEWPELKPCLYKRR